VLLWLHQKVFVYFTPPFSSWKGFREALFSQVVAVNDLNTPHAWPYLISSLLIAWLVFLWARAPHEKKSFRQFAFPDETYRHRSAIADYKFVAIDLSTRAFFVAPLSTLLGWIVYKGMVAVLPTIPNPIADPAARGVAASILALLIFDLGYYVAHRLMHRVPLLWHFHEIHHSAEVLTPVTGYRVHPMERLIMGAVVSVLTAFAAIFYKISFEREAQFLDIYGANVVLILLYTLGFQLRHSHVWFSYGPVGNRVLISPAQHQIHHSTDPKHWNKNFGYNLAVWDLLFGTLYVPRRRETLEFGLPGTNPGDFATVSRLYFLPFAKAWRDMRGWLARPSPSPAAPGSASRNPV
jgi:sterol desaturase/sphingolipid hydroxylase (fatty acid hydroxylase superfamily)